MGVTKKERDVMRREVTSLLILKFKPQMPQGIPFDEATLQFILEYIFGNIALKGASSSTEWEDIEVQTGLYTPGVGGAHFTRSLEELLPGEENKAMRDASFKLKVNFHQMIMSLTALLKSSNSPFVRNKTFRRLCAPFAEEAMNYLNYRKTEGEYSNLVMKMPETCRAAPEVCFDFNEGLDVLRLSATQTKVMQKLQRRLFASELKKNESDKLTNDHVGDQV
ncbi:coat protein [Trichosanthes tepovirus A]|nr:coat protein [Trichosanthes tepovirus A]